MKKSQSKKHHYLPRHYLQGFTDSQGGFFVYDKRTDSVFPTGPDVVFFENDLNNVVFPDGRTSDFLEKLYANGENQFWPCLNRIREATPNTPIALSDKVDLYLFLLFLHWRLPSNIKFVETLSEKFFRGENDLDYYKLESTTGDNVPDEAIEQLTHSSAFKKSAKALVPFAPFFKDKSWLRKLEDWRFLSSGDEKNWFLVGDNPIITHGYSDHDPVKCLDEFIFPISGKILLLSGNVPKRATLPPKFTVQHNAAIMERAQRFVACQRRDLLEALIDFYKFHVQHKRTDKIIVELFDMLTETKKE